MNWVGGSRSRIKLQNEKKLQKDFFERKRFLAKHQRSSNQPHKHQRGRQSQDLMALKAVTKAYSKLTHDHVGEDHLPRAVRKLDLAKFHSSERIVDEIEMPMSLSPGLTPSTLALNDVQHENCLFRKNSQMSNKPSNSESVFTPIQHRLSKDMPRKQTFLTPDRNPLASVPVIGNRINQQLNFSNKSKVCQKQVARHPRLGTIREESRLGMTATKNFMLDPFEEFQMTPLNQYYWSPDNTPAFALPEEDNQIVPFSSEKSQQIATEEQIPLTYSIGKFSITEPSTLLRNNTELKTDVGCKRDANKLISNQEHGSTSSCGQLANFKDQSDRIKSPATMFSRFQATPESNRFTTQQSSHLFKPAHRRADQFCTRKLFPDTNNLAEGQNYDVTKDKLYNLITPANSTVWTTPTKRRKISTSLPQKSASAEICPKSNSFGRISPLKESPSLFFRHRYINSSKEAVAGSKSVTLSTSEQTMVCGQNGKENWNLAVMDYDPQIKTENGTNQMKDSNIYKSSLGKSSPVTPLVVNQRTNSLANINTVSDYDPRASTNNIKSPSSCVSEPGTTDFWKRRGAGSLSDIKATIDRGSEGEKVKQTLSGSLSSRVFHSEMSFLQTFDTLRDSDSHFDRNTKENNRDMDEILSELNQLESQQSWESSCPISETKGKNQSEEMICSPESQQSLQQLIEESCDAENSMIPTSDGTEDGFETAIEEFVENQSQESHTNVQSDNNISLAGPESYLPVTGYGDGHAIVENVPTAPCNGNNGSHMLVENLPNAPCNKVNNGSHMLRENVQNAPCNGNNGSHMLMENVLNAPCNGKNGSLMLMENVPNVHCNGNNGSHIMIKTAPKARSSSTVSQIEEHMTITPSSNTDTTEQSSIARTEGENKSSARSCITVSTQTQTDKSNYKDTSTSTSIEHCDISTQWDPGDFSGTFPTSFSYDPSDFRDSGSVLASKQTRTDFAAKTPTRINQPNSRNPDSFPNSCTAFCPTSWPRKPNFTNSSSTSLCRVSSVGLQSVEQNKGCKIVLEQVSLANSMAQGTNQSAPGAVLEDNSSLIYSLRSRHKKE